MLTGLRGLPGVGYRARVVHGGRAVAALSDDVERLARRVGAGVAGSPAWTFPSVTSASDTLWAVTVRSTMGALVAVAVLMDVTRGGERVATLAGSDGGYRSALLATDGPAELLLCDALASEFVHKGAAVNLGPVTHAGGVLHDLSERLPNCELIAAEPIPHLRRGMSADLDSYLSSNMRRNLRKARNRLASDGIVPSVEFISDSPRMVHLLPVMEVAYRNRDHEAGRVGLLDSAAGRSAWRQRVLALLDAGYGEVAALFLDHVFAAYVLGVRDGTWYGIREGRFATSLARYAPGRLLEAAVVQRVLGDPLLDGVDWMSGVAPDSLLATNGASSTMRLVSRRLVNPLGREHPPRQRWSDEVQAQLASK